jgi:hypothetical protein
LKTCPVCGFHHLDTDTRCVRCSALLGGGADAVAGSSGPEAPAYRRLGSSLDCLARFRGLVDRGILRFTRVITPPLPPGIEQRDPWRAAFLSLLPGSGQFYNLQPRKAMIFIAVWVGLLLLAAGSIRASYSNFVLLALILWALYAFHDGYRTARRINGDAWHLRLSLGFYLAWIFHACILALLAQYALSFTAVKFRYMSEDALAPLISPGDRFAVDILSYRFRAPRVGEIVYYRPKPIALIHGVGGAGGANTYVEAPLNGIERIVAGPGDTFGRRNGLYYRNDQVVPSWEAPINRTEVTWDYEIQAPADGFVVIRSHTSSDLLGPAAPRMGDAQLVRDWPEACIVERSEIIGRAVLIYQPPAQRRWL